jgi:hypothetical protein
MEPASLSTKWEQQLQKLKPSNNVIEIFKVLSTIDRKVDSLADEVLNSPRMLTLLQQSLEGLSTIASIDPRIKCLCFSIINSLNTRKPNLIAVPQQLNPNVSLKSPSTETRQLVLDLKSLLINSSDNTQNIRAFSAILGKGLVQITEPEYRNIFLKDVATILDKLRSWNCFEDDNFHETLNLITFVIVNTDVKIPFYLIERLLMTKGNDILWKYALSKASLDNRIPFEFLKRDFVTIFSILNTDPVCKLTFINYLCALLKDVTQRLPEGKEDYLKLLNFYDFLKKKNGKVEIMELETLLYDVIPVQFRKGPVFLRKFQMELLTKSVQFDDQKHTTIPRRQFRLMIKHCYQIHQEDVHTIPLNDAITLLELALFFKDKTLQQEMELRVKDYLNALPKDPFGLCTEDSFSTLSGTLVKLAQLNLISTGAQLYLNLWPPIPARNSDLEKGMLFNQHNDLFKMYMRQLGYMHWLLSTFIPEERNNAQFTVLSVVNSYIAYQINDVFWANSASKIDAGKTANLLHLIRRSMEEPYEFALDYELRYKLKPINPPVHKPQKSPEKIYLNAARYSHCNLTTFLGLIRNLPIGEIILANNALSQLEGSLIKDYFPGVNLIYKEVKNDASQP